MLQEPAYDKIAYVSGALRTPHAEYGPFTPRQLTLNVRVAEELAVTAWEAGLAVICPHLNTLYMDGMGVPSLAFVQGDITMLSRMSGDLGDMILMAPNWKQSEGAVLERNAAIEYNVNVVHASWFGLAVQDHRLVGDVIDLYAFLNNWATDIDSGRRLLDAVRRNAHQPAQQETTDGSIR